MRALRFFTRILLGVLLDARYVTLVGDTWPYISYFGLVHVTNSSILDLLLYYELFQMKITEGGKILVHKNQIT